MSAIKRTLGKAVADRVQGDGPGPVRAFIAAAAVGVATGALTYRLLRSNTG